MKSHKIESFVFVLSIVSLIIFGISIPSYLIFGDRFLITDLASRLFFAYGGFSWIVIMIINWRRQKRGHKDPLSIEAMRTAKKELPNKIYKFCSLSLGNDRTLDEQKLYSLENKKIWMSDCSVLNDPYEGMYAFIETQLSETPNEILQQSINQIKNARDMYIQSSFSYDFDNILMWGHYANGCRGYCVEYMVKSNLHLSPVQYVRKRPLLSSLTYSPEVINNILKMERSLAKAENYREKIAYLLYIQAIKDLSWSYEKEVRLIEVGKTKNDSKCGNVNSEDYGLTISKIIIGHQCAYKKELVAIAKKINVPVAIMEISLNSNQYQLVEKEITYSCQ